MNISKNCVVTFDYKLTNKGGEVLDTSEGQDPLAYLHGFSNIIPGLESAMEGKKVGDAFKVEVSPEQGYGVRQDALMTQVPRAELAGVDGLKVGIQLQAETPQGFQVFTVAEIADDMVTLDGNHPLAGETLFFDVSIVEIREASEEEIAHGHVQGPGEHQH